MRLLGRVFNDRKSPGLHGGQHDVDRRAHRHHVEINGVAHQTLGHYIDHAMLHGRHRRSQRREALQMLIDGPHAEIAAARHGNPRRAEPAQQRADEIIRSPHVPRQIVRHHMSGNRPGIDLHRVFIQPAHLRADGRQNFKGCSHIHNVRYIFNTADAVGKDHSRKNGHHRVLGAADFHVADQPMAAIYSIFFQSAPLLRNFNIPIISPKGKKSNIKCCYPLVFIPSLPFFSGQTAVCPVNPGRMENNFCFSQKFRYCAGISAENQLPKLIPISLAA